MCQKKIAKGASHCSLEYWCCCFFFCNPG